MWFTVFLGLAFASPTVVEEWGDWVMATTPDAGCPRLPNAKRVCGWPGPLSIVVDENGATFSQSWEVYRDSWIPVMGEPDLWPEVTENGASIPLIRDVLSTGTAAVRLSKGHHTLNGRITWSERPQELAIPTSTGIVDLTLETGHVKKPVRTGGKLFLAEGATSTGESDSLDYRVYRLLVDDEPMRLTTVLELSVAGQVRDAIIPLSLPEGHQLLGWKGNLPGHLVEEGLRLQLRPGTHTLWLDGALWSDTASLSYQIPDDHRPEVWSFAASPNLRSADLRGGVPADPSQVGVPEKWRKHPANSFLPGTTVELDEQGRASAKDQFNSLQLHRTLWLDFDGEQILASDQLSGKMRAGWRLDVAPPYELKQASDQLPLLVTHRDNLTGVEVREHDLNLNATVVAPMSEITTVSGWQTPLSNASITLHTPPGFRLITALGPDRVDGAWTSGWDLLSCFFVLLMTTMAWRTFGFFGAVVHGLAFVLGMLEPQFPVFTLAAWVVAATIAKAAIKTRAGPVLNVFKLLSLVAVSVVALPFMVEQARLAVYPQLEEDSLSNSYATEVFGDSFGLRSDVSVKQSRSKLDFSKSTSNYGLEAQVQAGPGVPNWSWRSATLTYTGPVDESDPLSLYILSPFWVRLARLLGLLSLGLSLAGPLKGAFSEVVVRRWVVQLLVMFLPFVALNAHAQTDNTSPVSVSPKPAGGFVDADTRRAILKVLDAPAPCHPHCLDLAEVYVFGDDNTLSVRLTVDAVAPSALAMPISDGWAATNADALVFGDEKAGWLWVEKGRTVITLTGALPDTDGLQVRFVKAPRTIHGKVPGWTVRGVGGAIDLVRVQQEGDEVQNQQAVTSLVEIERHLLFGLNWVVTTTVRRVAPEEGPIEVRVPLLQSEVITSSPGQIVGDELVVTLDEGQSTLSWKSALESSEEVRLQHRSHSAERWTVESLPNWHIEVEELQPIVVPGSKLLHFVPRPNETVKLIVQRPEAVQGKTVAFDAITITNEVGPTWRTQNLSMSYRATQGAQHEITFPEGAELIEVLQDGASVRLHHEGQIAVLPISPGEHQVSIRWRLKRGFQTIDHLPRVDLGMPVSNVKVSVCLPQSRWLLFSGGEAYGPVVLIWGEWLVFLVIALFLAKLRSPLSFLSWLMLGFGFSFQSWIAFGLVAAGLLIVGQRTHWIKQLKPATANVVQALILLVVLATVAVLVVFVPVLLLSEPSMGVRGMQSNGNCLYWFTDGTTGLLPSVWTMTVSKLVYKGLVLLWSSWVALSLVKWGRWCWTELSTDGFFQAVPVKSKVKAPAQREKEE